MNHSNYRNADVVFHPGDSQNSKWVRSTHGWLAGVCEGLSRQFGMPVWSLRTIWVLFTLLSFGTGVAIYFVLAICLPDDRNLAFVENKKLLGVCVRLSRLFNLEVGVVRALTVLLGLASLGITVIGYFILNFVIPDHPKPLF